MFIDGIYITSGYGISIEPMSNLSVSVCKLVDIPPGMHLSLGTQEETKLGKIKGPVQQSN